MGVLYSLAYWINPVVRNALKSRQLSYRGTQYEQKKQLQENLAKTFDTIFKYDESKEGESDKLINKNEKIDDNQLLEGVDLSKALAPNKEKQEENAQPNKP